MNDTAARNMNCINIKKVNFNKSCEPDLEGWALVYEIISTHPIPFPKLKQRVPEYLAPLLSIYYMACLKF